MERRTASSSIPSAPPSFRATLKGVPTTEMLPTAAAAIDWLEPMAGDWQRLDTLPIDERRRLHRAIAALSTADPQAHRKRRKAARAERARQQEAVLNETGIRARRLRPVVTT